MQTKRRAKSDCGKRISTARKRYVGKKRSATMHCARQKRRAKTLYARQEKNKKSLIKRRRYASKVKNDDGRLQRINKRKWSAKINEPSKQQRLQRTDNALMKKLNRHARNAKQRKSGAGKRKKKTRSSEKQRRNTIRSEEHTSELQSQSNLVCRLLLEKKKKK